MYIHTLLLPTYLDTGTYYLGRSMYLPLTYMEGPIQFADKGYLPGKIGGSTLHAYHSREPHGLESNNKSSVFSELL